MSKVITIDGLPVVNARHSIHLEITARDVRLAKRKDPNRCAAAIACKRATKASEVRIHLSRIYVRKKSHWIRYLTSHSMRDQIIKFDRGKDFEPSVFLMQRVGPRKAAGVRQGSADKKRRNRSATRELKPYHSLTNVRSDAGSFNVR